MSAPGPEADLSDCEPYFTTPRHSIAPLDRQTDIESMDMMLIALPVLALALAPGTASTAEHASPGTTTYGVCAFASDAAIGGTELSPSRFLLDLLPKDFTACLKINDLSQQEWDWFGDWDKKLTVDVSSRPRHGRVDSSSSATYSADPGYTGKDRMEVFVSGKDMAGHPISMKLVYFINVVSDADFHDIAGHYRQSLSKYCHRTNESWRMGRLPAHSAPN